MLFKFVEQQVSEGLVGESATFSLETFTNMHMFVVVIQNFSNVTFSEMLNMSGGKEGMQAMQKERMEMMKDCMPMRMKRIIMYRR